MGVRSERKLATRQVLLDSALKLMERQGLSSLGLREITREAGIAPAAFYRHFTDLEELGVELVRESLGSMHALLREIRTTETETEDVIGRTVELVARHVREHRPHFRFLAREWHGGVAGVRAAIAAELDTFIDELVEDLATQPDTARWDAAELRVLARLYVNVIMLTAADLLDAAEDPGAERRIVDEALTQLRIVSAGRLHWPAARDAQSSPTASARSASANR